jgi:type I restriction enzyme S subunit
VLKPRKTATSGYYSHFFKAKPFIDSLSLFVTGIREGQNIDYERLSRAEMPMPSEDEQAAIVRFLDHANRKIDGFIRAKRKLIGLLNEQKQAIIHRAVTRGLYPDVLLKPSGIPWLGDIPTHWDTPLLGRCLTHIEQGWSPVGAEGELGERQWCVLTLSAVRRGVFDPEAIKPVSKSADIPRDIEVANGDLLLTRSNTRDRVGDVCLVKDVRHRTLLCDLIYRLTLRKGAFVPQFLVYQLLCPLGRGQIEKDARGSSGTMPKISQSHIKAWRVLLPPPEEQQAIVELIEIESGPIDTAIARTEREIALMQEYRTRLTADLVTGKLDVREAAANLPEAPAEPAAEEVLEEELLEETEPEEAE